VGVCGACGARVRYVGAERELLRLAGLGLLELLLGSVVLHTKERGSEFHAVRVVSCVVCGVYLFELGGGDVAALHGEVEGGAGALAAAHVQDAAHEGHEALGDRQAQPRAPVLPVGLVRRLREPVEDARLLLVAHPDPRVRHLDL
jgi:hypothetical protein